VGRFACDWHRLPGECPPGNHRPRREPAVSIASEEWRRDGPGRREHGDVACARRSKGRRARRRGGTSGQDVVHQDHPCWARPDRTERAGHRCTALRAAPPGLRREVDRPLEERDREEGRRGAYCLRQGSGLVEAALGRAPAGERHPRDHLGVGGGLPNRHHRAAERGRHRTPSSELQTVHCMAGRPLKQERGSGHVDVRRWTLRASGSSASRGNTAALAPRRGERDQLAAASCAEWPGPTATSRAAVGKQDVEDPPEHRWNLAGGTDTADPHGNTAPNAGPAYGSRTSRVPCPLGDGALTSMRRDEWARRRG
jgi:hypothetical protein